jgi:hypothetical protein
VVAAAGQIQINQLVMAGLVVEETEDAHQMLPELQVLQTQAAVVAAVEILLQVLPAARVGQVL